MTTKPLTCVGCPAHTSGRGFVSSRGPADAPLLFLASGPGEVDAELGSPFMGPAGRTLSVWCRMAGIDLAAARVANVAQCWQPSQRPPSVREVEHCRVHWGGELAGRRVIVPIGVPAMAAVYPGKTSESTAGQWAEIDNVYVCGLLHPDFIFAGNAGLEPLQVQILRGVREVLEGKPPHIYDFSKIPPEVDAKLYDSLEGLRAWRAAFEPGEELAVDIEAAGRVLRMVGMMRVRDLSYRAVWFRTEGGDVYPYPDFAGVVEWLYYLLASPNVSCCFHNGFYDMEQLEETGFEMANYSYDTLLSLHLAYPEMRKRLERVALLTAGMTGWKSTLRSDEGDQK